MDKTKSPFRGGGNPAPPASAYRLLALPGALPAGPRPQLGRCKRGKCPPHLGRGGAARSPPCAEDAGSSPAPGGGGGAEP